MSVTLPFGHWDTQHRQHAAVVMCGVPLAVAVMECVMVRQRCLQSRGSMRLHVSTMQLCPSAWSHYRVTLRRLCSAKQGQVLMQMLCNDTIM